MIRGLRAGEEEAVADFCARYGDPLERVAERNISPALRRRMGARSVVQSACTTFLRRAREGRFRLADSDELWRLLCAITLHKVREKVRFHRRQRRSVDREQELETRDGAAEPARAAPAPDEALEIAEEFEALMESLDEEERRIVELRLLDRSTAEIARELGCSERTVRRLTARLRERLERVDPGP